VREIADLQALENRKVVMTKTLARKPAAQKVLTQKIGKTNPARRKPDLREKKSNAQEVGPLTAGSPETSLAEPVRQKWEYATIHAQYGPGEYTGGFFAKFLHPDHVDIASPDNEKIFAPGFPGGFIEKPPKEGDCREWMDQMIRQMGEAGWEMVSAPGMGSVPPTKQPSYLLYGIYWFKRPC
jgi:hypothetical protein